ncbi:hypothetical protein CQ14_03030 [Bradyrhizobium lablabi]|uniref:Uncharacterized protein n=1 Tax=Bradyrhizobium lablabi TaxID=722472 RepID=A0A0R3N2T4_9BRAD|nr:hypothetical protein [Bradyrhizobium lablabi]KRR26475.1 hypothetical protein CQ14_03030 [Bradyrhizobium lablabi]
MSNRNASDRACSDLATVETELARRIRTDIAAAKSIMHALLQDVAEARELTPDDGAAAVLSHEDAA